MPPTATPVFVRHADTGTLGERVPAADTEAAVGVRLLSGHFKGCIVLWRRDKAVAERARRRRAGAA